MTDRRVKSLTIRSYDGDFEIGVPADATASYDPKYGVSLETGDGTIAVFANATGYITEYVLVKEIA